MNFPVRQRPGSLQIYLLSAGICLLISVSVCAQSSPSSNTDPANSHIAVSQSTTPASTAKPDLPKFTVATIKPAAPSDENMLMFTPNGISLHGIPMKMVLRESFGIEDDRILGAPGWVKNRYDMEAKVDPDDAPKLKNMKMDQRRAMLLPLLEERFNLKYHHETREMPMYALVVAKGGLKMKASAPEDPPKADDSQKAGNGEAKDKPQMGRRSLVMNGRGLIESTGTTTEMLSHVLAQQLGRTVVNKTGLTGNYDYTLKWTPDDAGTPTGGDADPGKGDIPIEAGGPTLLTALEEQLGLKLESQKGSVDVIVIDHIDTPSAN